jgi:hypothetical protein
MMRILVFVLTAASVFIWARSDADIPVIDFPPSYIGRQMDRHEYMVSPATELAIVLTAVAFRESTNRYHPLRRRPAYYAEVIEHFSPHASHPVFKAVGLHTDSMDSYINLRNSSYRWRLCGSGWCRHAFLGRWSSRDQGDAFSENIELIQDFTEVSGFLRFYEEHRPYYDELVRLYESRVDLNGMIGWLTREFGGGYQAYTILFSPLILGNQATTRKIGETFGQVFMIVDPPAQTEDLAGALNSFKWVFTELDHNFVNPLSDRHEEKINAVFSDRRLWTAGGQSGGYSSPIAVFNEYMTWAVYLLYVQDHFDEETSREHAAVVTEFMEERRGFPNFGDFLAQLKAERRRVDAPISTLYPELLEWAEQRGGSATAD